MALGVEGWPSFQLFNLSKDQNDDPGRREDPWTGRARALKPLITHPGGGERWRPAGPPPDPDVAVGRPDGSKALRVNSRSSRSSSKAASFSSIAHTNQQCAQKKQNI